MEGRCERGRGMPLRDAAGAQGCRDAVGAWRTGIEAHPLRLSSGYWTRKSLCPESLALPHQPSLSTLPLMLPLSSYLFSPLLHTPFVGGAGCAECA